MIYDFNQPFNRRGTNSWKWDGEGKNVKIAMGCAETDFRIASPIMEALHNKIDEGALTYPVNNMKMKHAFVGYCKRHYGIEITPEWICDSVGLMNGFRLMLEAFTHIGDSVIIQTPVFDYFNDTVENAGRHILENRMIYDREHGTYSINYDELRKIASRRNAKIMLICNPANPTARAYTYEELMLIYEICVENDLILISDEVHADFYYGENRHISILSLPICKDNVIVITSPSKTFNIHGFYVGLHIIPDVKKRELYQREYKDRHMDCMDLGMVASAAAYEKCDAYVYDMRSHISKNLEYIKAFLANNYIGVKLPEISATYLIWLDFLDWNISSTEIGELLNEYGLSMSNGASYGGNSDGFMRMNIATQYYNIKEAMDILKKIYDEKISK